MDTWVTKALKSRALLFLDQMTTERMVAGKKESDDGRPRAELKDGRSFHHLYFLVPATFVLASRFFADHDRKVLNLPPPDRDVVTGVV
jgi:hypothetical protein